jgi:hypothetical protein
MSRQQRGLDLRALDRPALLIADAPAHPADSTPSPLAGTGERVSRFWLTRIDSLVGEGAEAAQCLDMSQGTQRNEPPLTLQRYSVILSGILEVMR